MRHWILFLIVLVSGFFACRTQKHAINIESNQPEAESVDSVEYVLETFDAKFETWYALHNSPSQYRSKSYYEGWNQRYVSAWNYNASDPGKNWFFEPVVGYDPTIDYGFELNHKLFYYFMYVENVLKIEIMQGGPQSFQF
jgi:hypothetical protein